MSDNITARSHNLTATRAPTVTDDASSGYDRGSLWINISATIVYICVDGRAGAAVWKRLAAAEPAFSAVPTISGTEQVGQELTATSGTYTSTGTPLVTWQWYADDVAISGATSSTYTLQAAEEGAVVHVVQTVEDAYGIASSQSADTGAIAAA